MLIDIIFQIGKFISSGSNESLFVKILPAIISAIVAFIMFKIGQKAQSTQEKTKEHKRLNDLENLLYINLLRLKLAIQNQIISFNESTNSAQSNLDNKISEYSQVSFHPDIIPKDISSIPKNDIYKVISYKSVDTFSSMKVLSDFNSSINLLEYEIDSFKASQQKSVDFYNENLLKVLATRTKFDILISKFLYNNPTKDNQIIITDELHVKVFEILKEFNKLMDSSIDGYMKYFITPVNLMSVKFNTHKDFHQISELIISILADYNELCNLKIDHINIYTNFNATLEKVESSINALIKIRFSNMAYGEEIFHTN